MHTTINYPDFCVKYSEEFEDKLDVIRAKTGLGYIVSKFKAYNQPSSAKSASITEKLTREAQEEYRAIKNKQYKPYFERGIFTDTGCKDEQHEQDLRDQESFNRNALINQIMSIKTCQLYRHQLEELSTDRLMRLVERIGESI